MPALIAVAVVAAEAVTVVMVVVIMGVAVVVVDTVVVIAPMGCPPTSGASPAQSLHCFAIELDCLLAVLRRDRRTFGARGGLRNGNEGYTAGRRTTRV